MKKQSKNKVAAKAYYRLAKPGIIYGNLLTASGGFFLAAKGQVNFEVLLATLAGTALIIGSGCVFNNYIDRGIDAKMRRTRKRALVSGLIPLRAARMYGSVLGLLGVLALSLWTNFLVLAIGLAAWFFYVVLYGIAKRRSVHGTLVGTIPGAAAPVAGYAAASGRLDAGAAILFLIMVFWQMPHFYAIALYRLKDYKAAGLPVMPAKRGVETTKKQILAYIAVFILAAAMLAVLGYAEILYAAVISVVGLYWFWIGAKNFRVSDYALWGRQMFLFSLVVITSFSILLCMNAWLPREILYTFSIPVLTHAVIALASIGYTTYLFIAPAKAKFFVAYGLIALTLTTGTYLVWSMGAPALQACTTGLLYSGSVGALIISARLKLAKIGNQL